MSIVEMLQIPIPVPDWLLLTIVTVVLLYLYTTSSHGYFKKKNLPFLKPLPIVGNSLAVALQTMSFTDILHNHYKATAGHRVMGLFDFMTPVFIIRDPEIVKLICVKEFDHFVDHRRSPSENSDSLFSKSLFSLRGKRWKNMRTTLSPAFTSSKMKQMFLLMNECGQQVVDHLQQQCLQQPGGVKSILTLEVKDLFSKFATDVIATSAFGVKCDSLKDPTNDFYKMGKKVTSFTTLQQLQFILIMIIPKFSELFKVSFFNLEAMGFFSALIHDTVNTRKREGIMRPDMIHLMMEASKAAENDPDKIKLEEDDIAAQAVLFFFAGFESVTVLICWASYLLTVHPEIQSRLQEEIDAVLEESNQELTYDALQKMKYLDMIISETLRMYPPFPGVDRECVHPITIPGTETEPPITFEKGDIVMIPIHSLQRDPKYFPEPDKFDPERFSEENKNNIVPFSYLPFGIGPRVCIAQRFAIMEAKIALVNLLSNFTLHVVDKTPIPARFSAQSFNTTAADGFWCGIKTRNT